MSRIRSSADLDVGTLRADTLGCEKQIFFNNAGASLPPRPVVERVVEHLRLEERVGGYEAASAVAEESAAVYRNVGFLLNAAPEEIALTESATRAWQMAFYGMRLAPGDVILTAQNEYASNYIAFLQAAQRSGAQIDVVPGEPGGAIDLHALQQALARHGRRARLVALTHVATNNGLVQPAAEVGRLAQQAGVPFLLDACQSAGQMPLDVRALGCDMLSATGRKYLRGPRGTGFLYVRRGFLNELEPPTLDMHAAEWTSAGSFRVREDARRFEAFEASLALRLGLGRAVEYALRLGLDRIAARVQFLAEELRRRLRRTPGVTVQDSGAVQCGIVTFTHALHSPAALQAMLARKGVAVQVSPRENALLDMQGRGLAALVRASVHYYNTEAEMERFCAILAAL